MRIVLAESLAAGSNDGNNPRNGVWFQGVGIAALGVWPASGARHPFEVGLLNEGKTDVVQRTIVVSIAAVLMGATVHTQAPATTFAELPNRLAIGETVFVTNQAGQTVKGKVQQVSDTSLRLRSGQNDLTLAALDVQRIARRGHTLRNGALIGLAAGFTTGAIVAESLGCSNFFCPARNSMAIGGVFGAIGTGVGAAVGAALRRERVVFERAATGRPLAAITPLLSPAGAALLVQIGW